jgi:hypothetical protein
MNENEFTSDNDGAGGLLFRFVVWALALVLLGRAFENNSLYDLRQLRAEQVLVRFGILAVLLAFLLWALFVARRDVLAVIVIASAGFIGMHALPWVFVRMMTEVSDRREFADAREWRSITEDRDFD